MDEKCPHHFQWLNSYSYFCLYYCVRQAEMSMKFSVIFCRFWTLSPTLRYFPGVCPTLALKTTPIYSWCWKPAFTAMCWIGISVSTSSSLTRSIRTRTISSWIERFRLGTGQRECRRNAQHRQGRPQGKPVAPLAVCRQDAAAINLSLILPDRFDCPSMHLPSFAIPAGSDG